MSLFLINGGAGMDGDDLDLDRGDGEGIAEGERIESQIPDQTAIEALRRQAAADELAELSLAWDRDWAWERDVFGSDLGPDGTWG